MTALYKRRHPLAVVKSKIMTTTEPGSNSAFLRKEKILQPKGYRTFSPGGENRIRTCDCVAAIHAFQACAFNHSATSPKHFLF